MSVTIARCYSVGENNTIVGVYYNPRPKGCYSCFSKVNSSFKFAKVLIPISFYIQWTNIPYLLEWSIALLLLILVESDLMLSLAGTLLLSTLILSSYMTSD